jgi:hypothetical protein
MDNPHNKKLSAKVKVLGTVFLLVQMLFAVNNYGPHEIPLLNLVFDEPWLPADETFLQTGYTEAPGLFTFEDITERSGLLAFKRAYVNSSNPSCLEVMGGGVAVGDVNGNGYEDLFFVSMPSFANPPDPSASPPSLFKNLGDGTFQDITREAGLGGIEGFAKGALFFDYNNNGRQDLYIAAYDGGQLFRNDGGTFTNVTEEAGISNRGGKGLSAVWFDFNNNGWPDLYIANDLTRNKLYLNRGDGTFGEQTLSAGTFSNQHTSRGLAVIDILNNNKPDLVISNIDGGHPQLLMNTTQNGNNWLKLRLEGTESNRDALGARVVVKRTDGLEILQEVKAGGSYQSSSSKALFIGLDKYEAVEITIRWPAGYEQVLRDVSLNQVLNIKEQRSGFAGDFMKK